MHYLRPETAQGIFVNYANVAGTARKKPPFGIGQVGKSFRNEITPGNFIFRTREFEQMEMEFFVKPGTDEEWHEYWLKARWDWYVDLGLSTDNLRFFEHPKEKLSHYSKRTVDIEYKFNFGGSEFAELEGIANRTDFDLKTHSEASGVDLSYFDQETNERWFPYVIEPAAGLTRAVLAFLLEAYDEDEAPNAKGGVDKRTVMRFDKRLAPVKVAVLPLSRNADLTPKAKDLAAELRKSWNVEFDDAGAIGRRYRRQDEIGTPYCVTVDFDTLEDQAVTVRDRDTMTQERIGLDALARLARPAPPRLLTGRRGRATGPIRGWSAEVRLRPVGTPTSTCSSASRPIRPGPRWSGCRARSREDFLAHQARVLAEPANLNRVIEVDGEVVGSIATFPVGDGREVGYSIAREHWGRGIATDALRLMLDLDLTRPLSAGAAAHNLGSRRVLEKVGFREVEVGVDEPDGVVMFELS